MSFEFRPAKRENVPLLIGVSGGTGSGKTYTSLRLASGIAQGKEFAFIDTENKRGLHYADKFKFMHCDFQPDFSPARYVEAITAADRAGFPVIVVDSASHEWAGTGGVLDMSEAELERMAGNDWKKREACKMASWIKPKGQHKKMRDCLLQVRAHVILCFRAEEKVDIIKEDGKTKIVPKVSLTGTSGWMPICEKNLPFELTASFLLTADAPGIPKPIKLQEQHKQFFPLNKQITEESGFAMMQWANNAEEKPVLEDALYDIENVMTVEGLQFKFSEAQREFKSDPTALNRIIAAKDKRKQQLTTEGSQNAPTN